MGARHGDGRIALNDLKIVLVSPRNPLNIGAAARAMSNFGFPDLRLVNPYEVAFREARSAVGAADLLRNAVEYPTIADAVADCSLVVGTVSLGHRELKHPLRRIEYGGRLLRKHLASAPAALLFGSEKFGLANEDLSFCHWLIRIPTREQHQSMNLGQAVAICLYELIRNPKEATRAPKISLKAKGQDLDLIDKRLLEILAYSGYFEE
ncbi:MAG: RNA methyltransferase, partial [Acidobacteriia bacterium]|nr:RNA methyltransferase [Terriglobia bacterium]